MCETKETVENAEIEVSKEELEEVKKIFQLILEYVYK